MSATVLLEKFSIPGIRRLFKNDAVKRRRIYILPTRHGLLFGVMLFAILLGAVNYNNSMAYILTFLLISLAHVAMLHTYKNLAGLAIDEGEPQAVFPGEVALFPFVFDNRGGTSRFAIALARVTDRRWWMVFKNHGRHPSVAFGDIGPDALTHIDLPIKAEQRGRLCAGRIKIHTAFPLGLFRAWSYFDTELTCVIYPKPNGERIFPTPACVQETQGTQGTAAGVDDFIGYRAYRKGDSLKKIAWKAYAQEKGFLIKHFSGLGADKLQFRLQDVTHLVGLEAQLSQLCVWIIEANSQHLQYSLTLPDLQITAAQGARHFERCLKALALFRADLADGT